MSANETIAVQLAAPDDVEGFTAALRYLLYRQIEPARVHWNDGNGAQGDLFSAKAEVIIDRYEAETVAAGSLCLPREFVEMARTVALHGDGERFRHLHSMGSLLTRDRRIWSDRTHPLRLQLERMARDVGREIHKMHAFVRFRPVATDEGERHVAWFEPVHYVVRAASSFFVKRFASMQWAILTPIGCALWDRKTLVFAPPAQRDDAPAADAGELLWLAYYRSIFNPARVKVDMMRREMPVRFWKNLPEAGAISELLQHAGERTHRMQNEVDRLGRKGRFGLQKRASEDE